MRVGRDQGWDRYVVAISAMIVLFACYALIAKASRVARANREREGAMF